MPSRRDFLKFSALASAGMALPWNVPRMFASVQVPQTPLPGKSIAKFTDPLPTFVGQRVSDVDITVAVREFQQKVLPASFAYPSPFNGTYVWSYKVGSRPALYPGFTVEANRYTPTTITYVNELPYSNPFLQKYVTVDQTIHWANPLGLPMDDDVGRREPYAGPPPVVAHLHGAEVPSQIDGGPDAWFTPLDAFGGALHGGAYMALPGQPANAAVYRYPNCQEATTLWFHDHTLGATRLNVYAGLAAFYLLRDPATMDTGVESPGGLPAGNYEIEIVIQDRMFDTNGQWLFPDGYPSGPNGPPPNPSVHPFWIPEFFGDAIVVNGKTWPYLEVEPRRYRFRLLNGSNARMYELRLMNRATDRLGPALWVIGTDGGLLDYPVSVSGPTMPNGPMLFTAPGERYDVIVDFSAYAGQTLTLVNSAKAKAPNPMGTPADPQTVGQIMQFRVTKPLSSVDASYNPALGGALRTPMVRLANAAAGAVASKVTPDVRRQLTLVEVEGPGGPLEVLVNNTEWTGISEPGGQPVPGSVPDSHGNHLTELPRVGATELWEIINLTMDAHPIHLHLVQFQAVNRQNFNAKNYRKLYDSLFPGGSYLPGFGPPLDYATPNADGAVGGNPAVSQFLQGPVMPPLPQEAGWKDTLKMFPGQVTRIVVRFAPQDVAVGAISPGENKFPFDPTDGPGYVWHCHIIDHEDNEMMRPYNVSS